MGRQCPPNEKTEMNSPRRIIDLEIKNSIFKEDLKVIDQGLSNCPGKAEPSFNKMRLELSALSTDNELGYLLPV